MVVKIQASLRVEGYIKVDHEEAQIFHDLTPYDLVKWFAEKCSSQYTADNIRKVLCNVNQETGKLLNARAAALRVLEKYTRK